MRSRDFSVLVLNRIDAIGVCLFCDEYERQYPLGDNGTYARQHAANCPVTEYLRSEHARRGDKIARDRASKLAREGEGKV